MKIMACITSALLISSSVCATDIITTYDESENFLSVTNGVANEHSNVFEDSLDTFSNDEISLLEYSNGITILSDSSTISQSGGSITLTAEIEDKSDDEGVIWSIESGKEFATISQFGVVTAVTNGTVVVKATSTINADKFAYKTIIISIASETISVKLDVSAQYANIQNTTVDGVVQNWYDTKTASYPQGTKFRLQALKKSGQDSTFMYWWDTKSSRIVSFSPVYEFVLATETSLQAVYAYSRSATSKFVVFKDINDKILTQGYTSSTIKVPQNPTVLGYDFRCWSYNGNMFDLEPREALDTSLVTSHMIFKAGYTRVSEKYTVEIIGATSTGGEYMYNSFIHLTPAEAPEGQRFAYWTRDGKIVSYDTDYSFFVGNYDTTIEAVFVEKDVVIAEIPIIVMGEPQIVETNKIAFMAERNLPSQYTLIETGIILSSTTSDIDLNTSSITKARANSTENKGQFAIRKKDVSTSETWFAKGYMIYMDGDDIVTIYSDPVSKSL